MSVRDARDAIVVGDGLVGLACAGALAAQGLSVAVVGGGGAPGQASYAAAGMLAPGVERAGGPAHDFARLARDRYPTFLARLRERTGLAVPLNQRGVLQVALDAAEAERLRAGAGADGEWLDADALAALEPALAHAAGGILHARDGAVNNRRLLEALAALAFDVHGAARIAGPATRLDLDGPRPRVHAAGGAVHEAAHVVLAAGAWVGELAGVPRRLPVVPVRGQMLALAAAPLARVVYAGGGYAVPRGELTLVGSTMERVGFDAATTEAGLATLRAIGARIAAPLADAPIAEAWAGLRPVTPDGVPIIGREPAAPALLYACGHSRNGVLLAPATGEAIAALVTGEAPPGDLSAFAPTRFDDGTAGVGAGVAGPPTA